MHAFLRITDVEDVVDLIALLRLGASVGVEPVGSAIYGFPRPRKARPSDEIVTPVAWLIRVFDDREYLKDMPVPEGCRPYWEAMNRAAGRAFSPLQIVGLCELLQTEIGGSVEFQCSYGAPGWVEMAKSGRVGLVFWCRPDDREITDICERAPFVVNGEEALRRRAWFEGVSGPYSLPNRGVIRWSPEMTPVEAWTASGQPTGISPRWDRVAVHHRLCGIIVPESADEEARKAPGWTAMKHSKTRGMPPGDHPVRPVLSLPRIDAVEYLLDHWDKQVRIDLL